IEFENIIVEQTPKLDQFFHNNCVAAGERDSIEVTKRTLRYDTIREVFYKLEEGYGSDYSIEQLLWLKAPDIWKSHIAKKKKVRYMDPADIENFCEDSYEINEEMEVKDLMNKILKIEDPTDIEVMVMRGAGHTTKKIGEEFGLSTSFAKMRIFRFRNRWDPGRNG
ncbi:MAG: hypothetical protein ABUT20_28135, partial [Bacteroidota bacterium]